MSDHNWISNVSDKILDVLVSELENEKGSKDKFGTLPETHNHGIKIIFLFFPQTSPSFLKIFRQVAS